jgi:uncharacterized protein YcbK (DUF882 family)
MILNRRQVLLGGALAGVSAGGFLRGAPAMAAQRTRTIQYIEFHNLHTDEQLQIEYAREGAYDPAALEKIQVLLRDFRNGARHPIDPKLLDCLVQVAAAAGLRPRFSVISGYRSPQTNEILRERSKGVASHSLHMQGRAIDVRLAGIDCADLAATAVDLQQGGVGYYRASNFVHLDTGPFRTWRG